MFGIAKKNLNLVNCFDFFMFCTIVVNPLSAFVILKHSFFYSAVNALATSPTDYDEDLMANHIPPSPASSVPPNSPGPSNSVKAVTVSDDIIGTVLI